jgi:hypothetical protein
VRRAALLAATLGTLTSFASAQGLSLQPLRDGPLQQALIGTWCAPAGDGGGGGGGGGCWAVDVLDADGQLLACGRRPDDGEPFYGRGPYEVAGDRMCYRVEQASDSFWVRPGTRFCVRIVGISATRHVFADLDSRGRQGLLRLQPSQAREALQASCPLRP